MFINNETQVDYISKGKNIPSDYKQCYYTSPTLAVSGMKSGAAVVTSYLNCNVMKYIGEDMCSSEVIDTLYSKAKEIDEDKYSIDSEYPSLLSYMTACIDLGYMKNATVKFINDIDTLKNMIYNYDQVIIQVKITDTILNSTDFNITSAGTVVNEDFFKGFVAYGYDSSGLLVQNTRGIGIGSAGFQFIKWDVMNQIFVNGCLFDDD